MFSLLKMTPDEPWDRIPIETEQYLTAIDEAKREATQQGPGEYMLIDDNTPGEPLPALHFYV